jgi:uncharacterized protein (TIGR02646 family)
MLRFRKGREPRGLLQLRLTPGSNWDSVDGALKAKIRNATSRDQAALCAYCQRRVDPAGVDARGTPTLRVEHWTSRSTQRDQLTWSNLLGVCSGESDGNRHCDAARGDVPLTLHPVEGHGVDPRGVLRYLGDGTVESADPAATADVATLHLNAPNLRRGRRSALAGLDGLLGGDRTPAAIGRALERLDESVASGRAVEHVEVARYHLRVLARGR